MVPSQYCSVFFLFFISTLKQVQLITLSLPDGKVQGIQSQTENNNTYVAFLGMRYAQPPIGNLRFRAPLKVANWTGVYNATKQGNVCIQPGANNNTNNTNIIGNEDCLFINVYTTNLPNTKETYKTLPVLVWIHGGGFTFGSGNLEPHQADRFLVKDLVVVSMNYRLGAFGFLTTEDTVVPGNYGLKDQVLALQWVQENIQAFGGDPKKVTIFGESAGAASVHYLRQAKRARNLFHKCIADSGNTLNPWSISRNARTLAFRIGLLNNIWTISSKTLVERLRTVNAYQLQKTSTLPALLDLFDPLNGLPFAPHLEEPSVEAVYTKFSYVAQEEGYFNHVPLLHGFNSKEAANLVNLPWFANLLLAQYDVFPSRLTPLDMNASNEGAEIVGRNIKSYYFHNQSVTTQPGLANYLSDTEFVRGIVKSTVLETQYSSIYLYRFSFHGYAGAYPLGVSHADELPFLWKTPFDTSSPAVRLTIERMVQMWSNFVKTGNPTSDLTSEVNVTWPIANATGGSTVHYLDIGDQLVPSINPEEEEMEFWEQQYEVYGYPPYNTY